MLAGQATAGMTVAGLVDAYLADPGEGGTAQQGRDRATARRNVVPVIGAVKLSELRRRDVRNVTDAILRRGRKVEATRVFEDVRGDGPMGSRERISRRQPARRHGQTGRGTSRNRVLSDDEIRTLWNGLPKALPRSVQCQRIIKLCLVTGAARRRSGGHGAGRAGSEGA